MFSTGCSYNTEKNTSNNEDEKFVIETTKNNYKEIEVTKENVLTSEVDIPEYNAKENSGNSTKLTTKTIDSNTNNQIEKDEDSQVDKNENTTVIKKTNDTINKSNISSKAESWYIILNTENKPSKIPDYRKKWLEKYNGIYIGDITSKNIYLTFDIGTITKEVEETLDILKKKNVKTIFFITDEIVDNSPELLFRIIEDGHTLGNHTMTHKSLPDLSKQELIYELEELNKKVFNLTGKKMKYFRTPMGNFSEKVLMEINNLGYKTAFWSYAYNDYDNSLEREENYTYNKVMTYHHNGAIILMHAAAPCNVKDLERVIDELRNKGYVLSPFDL
jgi:peptidoglycan-N-acetylmuramic acid deacetylase